jgi:hypothetical protein
MAVKFFFHLASSGFYWLNFVIAADGAHWDNYRGAHWDTVPMVPMQALTELN